MENVLWQPPYFVSNAANGALPEYFVPLGLVRRPLTGPRACSDPGIESCVSRCKLRLRQYRIRLRDQPLRCGVKLITIAVQVDSELLHLLDERARFRVAFDNALSPKPLRAKAANVVVGCFLLAIRYEYPLDVQRSLECTARRNVSGGDSARSGENLNGIQHDAELLE